MGKIYLGQIDVEIKLDAKVSLGTPDVLQICYKKPDGTSGVFPSAGNASVVESTKAQYFTDTGDLGDPATDDEGIWVFQIYAELPGGFKGYGEEVERKIYKPKVL